MRNLSRALFLCTILFFLRSCDHGLEPPAEEATSSITGISGTIYYQNWPPPDSLFDLRLIVFKTFPPQNILSDIINGNAIVHPPLDSTSLPYFVDSTAYRLELKPGRYEYIVVAQQFGPNIYSDWRAVGQYDTTPDSLPTAITVQEGELLQKIDINVDFRKLLIQPF